MGTAVISRGKALVAIILVVVLLLAILSTVRFAPDAVEERSASTSPHTGASATNDMTPTRVTKPPVSEGGSGIPSSIPANERTLSTNADQENGVETQTHREAEAVTPAADSLVDRNPNARRAGVAAECWGLRGSATQDFAVTLDREMRTSGAASALVSSRRDTAGYATLFQSAAAAPVRGKRVEFSADLRTRGTTGGANLLLRAEDAGGNTVAFDNMVTSFDADRRPDQLINRGVKGDTEWSTQHVVVDIPDEARVITYGVSLFGGGKAWIDNARIEVVSNDMATTAIDIRQSPQPVHNIPVNPASLARSPRNLEFDLEAQAGALPCN